MEEIFIYNTQQRKKVKLIPIETDKIRMYVCGPTVYDSCHIGHARPAVCFDTIRRYLEYSGYAVTFVSNITDIDDKIIERAGKLGISCRQLTQRYQDEYERDMSTLGVRSPTIRPKATEHIKAMLNLIKTLIKQDIAYLNPRGVWFDVSKFSQYGKLSGRTIDDENTEHRVEGDPEKRNPQDFALWKTAKPGEPSWESPWGAGRPGWHIECSAMSGKFFGFQLDIHGGGADLTFPHHENEIAQSEAATGKEFVRYWMHNGFITVAKQNGETEKMGKSKGNAFWLQNAFKSYPPAALRLWILGTHYRSPLTYTQESLQTAFAGLNRIYNCIEELELQIEKESIDFANLNRKIPISKTAEEADQKFCAAMNDDFNTAQALAAMYDLISQCNSSLSQKLPAIELQLLYSQLQALLGVLGLPLERPHNEAKNTGDAELLQLLIDTRQEARKNKQFQTADFVRDGLDKLQIELKDRSGGTTWSKKQ